MNPHSGSRVRIKLKYDLGGQNTFRMKVRCECFVEYENVAELAGLNFDRLPRPLLHIGEGSNLLFTGDFPGTVLHSNIEFIKYVDIGLDEVPVIVGAGVNFDSFVAEACRHGLWGTENLSMIPGEVGAAAVQNIGAYGAEVADIVSGVVCFDLKERKKVKFTRAECRYGYRTSMFKEPENKGRYVVTSVLFRLSRKPVPKTGYKGVSEALGGKPPETPGEVREAVMKLRRGKLPDPAEMGNAGSFFKNPVVPKVFYDKVEHYAKSKYGQDYEVPHFDAGSGFIKIPAAWLIEQCGWKGYTEGNVGVYAKQPLVLVNRTGAATPDEIIALEKKISDSVMNLFGIGLNPEVEHI